MPSENRTVEQKRAKDAWDRVEAIKDKEFSGDYKSLVKNSAALILTNGLTQTLAFFGSKERNKKHHAQIKQDLSNWVCKQLPRSNDDNVTKALDTNDLARALREGDSYLLRLATQEALAYVQWLQRFADAQIEKEGKDKD